MSLVDPYVGKHYPWLISLHFGSDAETKEEAAAEVVKFLRNGAEIEVSVFATSEGYPFKVKVAA